MVTQSKEVPVLEVRDISKAFSGIDALRSVSIKIYPGQVNAVIGENGAGKSTLMKIISGIYSNYEGEIFLEGEPVRFNRSREAADKGIVIIHQELNLVPELTIAENIFLGQEPVTRFGLINYQEMHAKTKELLDRLDLSLHPATKTNRLRIGQQQLVEIARALLSDSKVLIMDEPTSAISEHEVKLLFRIIKSLKEKGVAVVYISHKLDELFEIADLFTVLRDGEMIGAGKMAEISYDGLIRMMVGRDLKEMRKRGKPVSDEEILRIENLCLKNPSGKESYLVNKVSFTLHKGEVLGICGLMGAGRTELLESIFGLYPKYVTGRVFVGGSERSIRSINEAIRTGLALVPEDRKLQGLILNMNVDENTSLASLDRISKFSFINKKQEENLSRHFIDKLRTRVASSKMEVSKLSGGNQQKVVIAKWLAVNPQVLLLDEPTRGIDIGAKGEIYDLIDELAGQGMGIVVVSSELTEILAIADTILVMSESRQTLNVKRPEATEELLMKAALAEKV
ncbi:MAG: D-xylose ABC transporter ATP-binding protein [Bacteroidetes bacterium RBG_13_44_24]|nr:MAG: D-xylose ABC transporter ATP-binding protein [Bacteroidetes bacterium RBG_13_44_24]